MEHNISELLTLVKINGATRKKYTNLSQRDILVKLANLHTPIDTNIKTIAHHLISSSQNFTFDFTLSRLIQDSWRRDTKEYKKRFETCPICKEPIGICGTLEAHEIFSYNYKLGVMQVDDIKVMCKYCHLLHHKQFLNLCKSRGLFPDFDVDIHLKKVCIVNKVKVFTMDELDSKTIELYVKNSNTIQKNYRLGIYNFNFDMRLRRTMHKDGWKIAMLPEYNGYAFTELKKSLIRKNLLYFEEIPSDIETLAPLVVNKIKHEREQVHKPKKKIRCITTGKEFYKIKDALEFYRLSKNTINRYLSGSSKHGGYLDGTPLEWEYFYE